MQLTKYRAFGKSRFIQMAVSLLSMLIYWGFSSGIFEILFNYNESSIDYNAQKAEQVRHDMLENLKKMRIFLLCVCWQKTLKSVR